jgi:hypothetical protein
MTLSQEWERMRPLDGVERQPVVWAMMHAHAFDPVAFLLKQLDDREFRPALPVHPLERGRDFRASVCEGSSPGFEEVQSACKSAWELAKRDRMTAGIVLDEFDRIAPLRSCPIGSAAWGMDLFEYRRIISAKKLAEQKEHFQGERYMGPYNAT